MLRSFFVLLLAASSTVSMTFANPTVVEIRKEVLKPPRGEEGRPLPLAAHWNVRNWGPFYQNQLIKKGHHILPWIAHPRIDESINERELKELYRPILAQWAAWDIPFTIRDGNWLNVLQKEPYRGLAPELNPLTIQPDGDIDRRPSPFGPVEVWRKAAKKWTDNPMMEELQKLYPDPPFVMFLANNETRKLRWHELDNSKRFLDEYGKDVSDVEKRKIVSEHWIERYNVFHQGMLEGLKSPVWKDRAMFVGYDAFGPAFYGRWPGWKEYAICSPNRIAPQPLYWDGGSPSFYDNNWQPEKTDYRVWSPQVACMNWVFQIEEALDLNPDFWFEMSVWDGDRDDWSAKDKEIKPENSKPLQYIQRGQEWTPERYKGRVQYGMWIVRPRSVREFRGHIQPRVGHVYEDFWLALLAAVDHVWENETLTRFWRFGELVPNTKYEHPWQANTLKKYKDENRWFLLDTNLDAPRPWDNKTEIPVFSLAHCIGEKPNREWLLYAHSPLKKRDHVFITIPDYREVVVDVDVEGSFYHLKEKGNMIEEVVLK